MSSIKINKHCEIIDDEVYFSIEFVIPVSKNSKATVIVNASGIKDIDWSKYITENYTYRFSDQIIASRDNSYLIITKNLGRLFFVADSLNGFKFEYSVDFDDIAEEIKELDTWFRKIKY